MKKVFLIIAVVAVSFAAGYEAGNSLSSDLNYVNINDGISCPYLQAHPSAEVEGSGSECPYLNNKDNTDEVCPYSGKSEKDKDLSETGKAV